MTNLELTEVTSPEQERGSWWLRAMLLSLPLLLLGPIALLLVVHRFDGLYGQDSYAYYRYATGPLRQALLAIRPPPPFFWPPGYPLFIFLLSLVLGSVPMAGQVASLAGGALVPVMTALLGRELWQGTLGVQSDRWLPLLAGLFAVLSGQLWQSSAVVMSDTTALAAATVAAWALARYSRGERGRWLLLAAGAASYAVLTRWAYALVAFPLTAAALLALTRRPRREGVASAVAAGFVVLVVLSPVIASTLQGERTAGGESGAFIGDLEVVPWDPTNALRSKFVNSDGVLRYRLPNGLYYALAPAHRYLFTPLLALLLLPGLWLLWRHRTALRLLLLVGWPGVVYLFLAGAPWQNFRFVLPYLPPLAILAALGVAAVGRVLPRRARPLLGVVIAVGLLWMAYGGWTLTEGFILRKAANLRTMEWVEAQIPAEARLFTFAITLTFEQYSDLEVYDLFHLTPQQMADLLEEERPAYLLLDTNNVESQWLDRAPSQNYHWLQQEPGLTPLGERPPFSLFQIGSTAGSPP